MKSNSKGDLMYTHKISLLFVVLFSTLFLTGCPIKIGVWPLDITKWNVYPDVIFSNGCSVHAQYNVTGGENSDNVQLILTSTQNNEEPPIVWNEGRSFDSGYAGNSPQLYNGRPGVYSLKLMINGDVQVEHNITILNPPMGNIPHTITYQWPQDLAESRVLTASTRIQNVRTSFNENLKDTETLPLILCTKYMWLKAITLNSASDFQEGDTIQMGIGFQELGAIDMRNRTIILSQPISIRPDMVLSLRHWHGDPYDPNDPGIRPFRQGGIYKYDITYTVEWRP